LRIVLSTLIATSSRRWKRVSLQSEVSSGAGCARPCPEPKKEPTNTQSFAMRLYSKTVWVTLRMVEFEVLTFHQQGKVCTADYCDILDCPSTRDRFNHERSSSLCSERKMQQIRLECYALIHTCFDHQAPLGVKMADQLQNTYCNRFYCSKENDIEAQWGDPTQVMCPSSGKRVPYLPPKRQTDSMWWWLKFSMSVVLFTMLTVYYVGVCLWRL
jgi:hypothetical protein